MTGKNEKNTLTRRYLEPVDWFHSFWLLNLPKSHRMLPKQPNSRDFFCFLTSSSIICVILLFRSWISSTILPCSASTLRISSSRASSTHLNKWFSFFRYIETKIILGEVKWNEKTCCLSYTIENRIRQKRNITAR